jgi:hypothetical protein
MKYWKMMFEKTLESSKTHLLPAPTAHIRQAVCADCLASNLNKMYLRLLDAAVTTLSAARATTLASATDLFVLDVVIER